MGYRHSTAGIGRRGLFAGLGAAGLLVSGVVGRGLAAPAPAWVPVPIPAQAPAKSGVADLPGTRLYYWDTEGPGHPVVLMHAGTQSAAGWVYQQPVLAQAGFRAIAYSRRSYEGSDPGDPDNPGIAADDLLHLLAYLKVDKVDLVAAAHGGFFALDFILAYPEKVRSLTVVSSLMGITDPDYVEVNARLRPKFFASLPHDFQELSPSYRAGNPEGLAAWNALDKAAVPGKRVTPRLKAPLTWARLGTIKHPTMLITGDADLYTPPSLLRMQAQRMPHAEVHIVDEAGHCPYWEQPIVFNELLLNFLRRQ